MNRFGIDVGSVLVPKCLSLGTLLALKIDQKIDPKSDCLKGRSKIAPGAPKTLPRRPPNPPGEPQDPPRRLPDPSRTPPDALPDPPGRPKMLFRSIWPNDLFRKSKTSNSSKTCRIQKSTTVIHSGHPHWSSQKPKALSQRSEPRGWRRWSREALFNPPPPAQHGVL